MFDFLERFRGAARRRNREAFLARCQRALNELDIYVHDPSARDRRAALPRQAHARGWGEDEAAQRLAVLDQVYDLVVRLAGLNNTDTPHDGGGAVSDGLLADSGRLGLGENPFVKKLSAERELVLLPERGPQVLDIDTKGRAVYLRCTASYNKQVGQVEVREDGMTFVGEVVLNIPWTKVTHATTVGMQLALQEGTRRTPTKFQFRYGDNWRLAHQIAVVAWQRVQRP